MKKILILIAILAIIGVGLFFYWQNSTEVSSGVNTSTLNLKIFDYSGKL